MNYNKFARRVTRRLRLSNTASADLARYGLTPHDLQAAYITVQQIPAGMSLLDLTADLMSWGFRGKLYIGDFSPDDWDTL